MTTIAQLESLKKALFRLSSLLQWCHIAVSRRTQGVYASRCMQGPHEPYWFLRFIDFASATSEDLDFLLAACNPATLGRGNEDVYDESYRKAVKMDVSNFAVQLDPASSGLVRAIEDQLLHYEAENMYISAELYKLNVYGNSCHEISPV